MNSTERCGRTPPLSNAAVKRPARSPVINYMAFDLHKHCAPGGIRTPNLLIRSQMLYPLSYGRMATAKGSRAVPSPSNPFLAGHGRPLRPEFAGRPLTVGP